MAKDPKQTMGRLLRYLLQYKFRLAVVGEQHMLKQDGFLFVHILLFGDFRNGGLSSQGRGELFPRLHGFIGDIAQGATDADSVVVAQVPADFTDNHGYGIRTEFDADFRIKMINGFHQTDTAYLKQIIRVFPPFIEPLDHRKHQSEISLY